MKLRPRERKQLPQNLHQGHQDSDLRAADSPRPWQAGLGHYEAGWGQQEVVKRPPPQPHPEFKPLPVFPGPRPGRAPGRPSIRCVTHTPGPAARTGRGAGTGQGRRTPPGPRLGAARPSPLAHAPASGGVWACLLCREGRGGVDTGTAGQAARAGKLAPIPCSRRCGRPTPTRLGPLGVGATPSPSARSCLRGRGGAPTLLQARGANAQLRGGPRGAPPTRPPGTSPRLPCSVARGGGPGNRNAKGLSGKQRKRHPGQPWEVGRQQQSPQGEDGLHQGAAAGAGGRVRAPQLPDAAPEIRDRREPGPVRAAGQGVVPEPKDEVETCEGRSAHLPPRAGPRGR
ncbi:homeobox protein MOX-1 isoform X1 [Oryctolagus cuniculus]|uniref:homeobox protein MOX-1 isoform X1 n=1 Tax=Oryctolagus cuniculus TaxID=9986 RepID=UPI0038795C2D